MPYPFTQIFIICAILIIFSESCGSSGSCGCCGCRAKAKARAAKRLNGDAVQNAPESELVYQKKLLEEFDDRDDGNIFGLKVWNDTKVRVTEKKLQQLTNPNHLFHICCEERQLPAACIQKCHFNVYNKSVVRGHEALFLRQCQKRRDPAFQSEEVGAGAEFFVLSRI
uniref:CX domain-containing protein n=1 Tax=Caenorhabditis japonica TaxID=281687 RepID=A0A8R1DG89_CAEJA